MPSVDRLIDRVTTHRVYNHPLFDHWSDVAPPAPVLGAMFHQIQKFCSSTRPGLGFPDGLEALGLSRQKALIDEVVASESGHGPELATMAGYVVNASSTTPVFTDLGDATTVEAGLKAYSDTILGNLPGYDGRSGLTAQAANAIAVFERRALIDAASTQRNLGTALALEIISNQSLIPGEKRALVDSGNLPVNLHDPEMHYLAEHWGECGAEQQHERNVIEAVGATLTSDTAASIEAGITDFVETLASLWDVIDTALLGSGQLAVAGA